MTAEEMQAEQLRVIRSFEELARAAEEREQTWRERCAVLDHEERTRVAAAHKRDAERREEFDRNMNRQTMALEHIADTLHVMSNRASK